MGKPFLQDAGPTLEHIDVPHLQGVTAAPSYLLVALGPLLVCSGAVNSLGQVVSHCPMLAQVLLQQGAGLEPGSAALQCVKCSMAWLS